MIFHSTYNKPILLVGNGVRTSGSVELVHEFISKTNIPALTTMNAVDIVQDDLHIGFIGTHGNRIANMIMNECDLVISVGARLGIRQVGRVAKKFAPKAELIRCDIDEYELSRNIKENEVKYHTDASDFMRALLKEDIPDFSKWKNKCFEAKTILDAFDKQPGNFAVETIASLLPENPIVSVDVGMHQCWCAQSLVLRGYRGRIHISGGYGTMGCALPYAIGSSIASGKKGVFCITGDGGFQMNIQELETVKRENLPTLPSLKYLELSGEHLFEQYRNEVQDVFGAKTVNMYGCNETNAIAIEINDNKLHVLTENVFVEVIKDGITKLEDHSQTFTVVKF